MLSSNTAGVLLYMKHLYRNSVRSVRRDEVGAHVHAHIDRQTYIRTSQLCYTLFKYTKCFVA